MDKPTIILIARLLIGFLFIFAAVSNLINHQILINTISERKVPLSVVLFYIAVIIQLISGVCIFIGFEVKIASMVLICFVIMATLIFHDFWNATGDFHRIQCISFVTNLSTIGALLLLIGYYK